MTSSPQESRPELAVAPFSARARLDTEVRALLHERIVNHIYPVGKSIPSEVNLAAELGVSRVTLRQALKSLEDEGVLVKKHGVGTFVSEPPPVLECVLHENLGVTEMIRRSGLTPGTIARFVIDPFEDHEIAEALGNPGQLVALERVRTADDRPIAVTTDVVARSCVPADELSRDDVSIYGLLEEHGVTIVRGTATLLPTQATDDVAAALSVPTGTVLLMLEQVDYGQDGSPVVFSRELWVRRAIRFVVNRQRDETASEPRRTSG